MYFVHCLLLRTPETVQRVECKKRFPHSFVFTCFFPHVLVHAFFCLKWTALSPMRWCRDACMYLSRRLLSSLYTEWSSSYSLFTTWWCSAFDCCCCCSCCVCLFWLSARARCDHKRKNWMESAYIMSTCSFLDFLLFPHFAVCLFVHMILFRHFRRHNRRMTFHSVAYRHHHCMCCSVSVAHVDYNACR